MGCHCPPTNASAGADRLGIFFPLRFWLEGRGQGMHLQEMDSHGAKHCHSCGCHSSPARHLHPKYIHPVAFLKISMEWFHPHGCGHPARRSSPGDRAALTAAARDGAALPAVSTLTLCLQVIFPLFTENRLIHSLIISLSTYLSSACQVPSGYPFSLAPGSPCSLANEEVNVFF